MEIVPMRLVLLFAAILVLPLLGSDSSREYDGATVKTDVLDGSWEVTEMNFNGSDVSFHRTILAFRGGNYTETGGKRQEKGTYKADVARTEGHLDLTPSNGQDAGKTFQGIYRVDGDVLQVARKINGKPRPLQLKEEAVLLITYKRLGK
jgi:uncharacterized protein (TIGR03067 family)